MFGTHLKMFTISNSKTQANANSLPLIDVRILSKQGRLKEALHILPMTDNPVDSSTYVSLLEACIRNRALPEAKLIHAHINRIGFKADRLLHNTLVKMYVKCECLADARRVFDRMPQRDECSWTLMMAAYARHGFPEDALSLFHQMKQAGVHPDQFTFSSVLPACADLASLDHGIQIHEEIIECGYHSNVFVMSALVDMYAKCGSIERAREVFDKMPERNVVSWTAMIAAYSRHGLPEEALVMFRQMRETGVQPNHLTLANVVQACASLASLEKAMEIHEEIIRIGFQSDVVVTSSLVDMYAKCGSIETARTVFDKMSKPDVVSWTVMIAGYAQAGHLSEALKFFEKMPQRDIFSWTAMISGYAQNGLVDEALKLFNEMPERNVVSWNAMIAGFAQNGLVGEALKFFKEMPQLNVASWNAMIAGFAQNGFVREATDLFMEMPQRNSVSWNAMLAGFAQNGFLDKALKLFQEMPQTTILSWNVMIAGYMQNGLVDEAQKLFQEIPQRDVFSWTAMVSGLAQNGLTDEALKFFKEMPHRTVVAWNAMIAGFAQNGHGEEALKVFQQMQLTGVRPDSMTFASILPAFANLAALELGKEIHGKIVRSGFHSEVVVVNTLIDMYAKCGSTIKARQLFDKMNQRNVVSWTAMIAGYAMHGFSEEALKLFEKMKQSSMKPNCVTLVCILSACSHAGLVDEGYYHFKSISENYHMTPIMEHYCCMVDLLGRAGRLHEAQEFINKMPITPDAAVWSCLLSACSMHNNLQLGEYTAERILQLGCKDAAPYVLLSNIYAAAGRWDDIKKVRKLMKDRGIKKTPGCSWIEINNHVHAFLVEDRSHPQMQKIYLDVERLSREMKEAGFVTNTRFVKNDVEEGDNISCHNIEKPKNTFELIDNVTLKSISFPRLLHQNLL